MFQPLQAHLSGVYVPHHKDTAETPIVAMPIPARVKIPMNQQIGAECEPLVTVGEQVLVGQLIGDSSASLSAPVHASVSGEVRAVEDFFSLSGQKTKAIVIASDGQQTLADGLAPPLIESHADFVRAVRRSGLVGMGGAGFPTHVKLRPDNFTSLHTLLVNAAECEPYITADYRAIMECGDNLFLAMEAVMRYLNLERTLIGIEDNKPRAIAFLEARQTERIKVHTLPSRYPQGGEKVLIYETMGVIVEEGRLPMDYGVIVMNVSSLAFLGCYLRTGIPVTSKWITVAGSAIARPQNVYLPLGTSYHDVIDFCGGYAKEPGEIFMGGPMMGISVFDDDFPVLKNNNAVIALAKEDVRARQESPCIRCARCVQVCPFRLMPAAIDAALQADDLAELAKLKVNLCMECGCCAYICPAHRQLVLTNKLAKQKLRQAEKRKPS